jgi:hypothetical protein
MGDTGQNEEPKEPMKVYVVLLDDDDLAPDVVGVYAREEAADERAKDNDLLWVVEAEFVT